MRNISQKDDPDRAAIEADVGRVRDLIRDYSRRRCLRDPLKGISDATVELSPPQVHALMALGIEQGSLPMGELARRGGVTEKTITGVVDRMEAAGLIRRERDEDDRRVVLVRLTARGTAVQRRLEQHMHDHLFEFMSVLDARDRRDLLRILERLRDHLIAEQPQNPPSAKEPS